mmetsp:Transcript_1430/g.2030  ORF Transcript_1430/g.2030 Transcript_1430/m.2030 type:complete len:469 (+) Transcript_1430:495-1901(+)|eukprot:CAMPEP_0196580402 /NCGR_PEP_ID=MMETSP1081-20130531/28605_1 /TAXON_ID=36882 /ORGANISM="Pyramimonas amylifera, Strain CCMP720" /LENGTH=468 /DNA_ID=CAMNT_0041900263 /DNA_START=490 /DNA_END=1896 /DNA_ORIENTATION=-
MSLLNIGAGNADDAFYRYKMPPLQSKIEGRGNGIKTNIVNMVDVAKALARPPAYTTKFFGCELGAQSKFDEKSGTAIVNGAHDQAKLMQLLEGFIKRFVQCYACGNPETEVQITKTECINLQCKACGNLSTVDMRHKLTTFILKNPPDSKGKKGDKDAKKMRRAEQERLEAGDAVDKAEKAARKEARRIEKERLAKDEELKKKEKKEKKKREKKDEDDTTEKSGNEKSTEEDEEEEEESGDVEWSADLSSAAQAARAKEQLTEASRKMVTVKDTEAAAAELEALNMQNETVDSNNEEIDDGDEEQDDEEEEDLIEGLRDFASKRTAVQVAAFLSKLPVSSVLARVKILVYALFGDAEDLQTALVPRIKAKQEYLKEACQDGQTQLSLIYSLEGLIGTKATSLSKEMAVVLKELYDSDIAVEEVIIAWYDKPEGVKSLGVSPAIRAKLRKAAFPVVDWLRNADEESDEE